MPSYLLIYDRPRGVLLEEREFSDRTEAGYPRGAGDEPVITGEPPEERT